ncbi:MAG: serpin family protein [Arthrospira platensis PCC 7345]|uniref:Serine protease inhibitor n=1 Tax=Limnospira platensis NIES-46 TaxID=1236695 RepID=A0A5M3TA03_LIMPL|nr:MULTISPECIES: serpin family protein [Arthrospira]MDF2211172.1 serpin family protein [Arthrospira platensis NCB002]MDT9293707.1 serpin family protein [Arthrospira platensis PCC 7345]BDT11188.1 probable serine protease inhibitor [Arthrospira platensis NIES-39]GCE94818.1 putative serine protease inhibitor [Arthrospira platensis NIES-46]
MVLSPMMSKLSVWGRRNGSLLASLLLLWGVSLPTISQAVSNSTESNSYNIARVDTNAIVNQNNQFALDLYNQLKKEISGNLFFSPYSLSTAMAMTYEGSRNQTAMQISQVFHFHQPPGSLYPEFTSLVNDIKSRNSSQLYLVNRLWGQSGYRFQEPFLQITKNHYNAPLTQVDFRGNHEESRQTINDWISQETNHKITDLIAPGTLDVFTRLILTNAVYFAGDWLSPFPEKYTQDGIFNLPSGETISVPMMHHPNVSIGYHSLPEVKIIELPYADGNLSMIILLPAEGTDLPTFADNMTIANLQNWLQNLEYVNLQIWLPKFNFSSSFNLKSTLSYMGMESAFTEIADFSGISSEKPFFLYDVVHQAFVNVDEKGTEASAATGVIAGSRSSIRDRIHINRPFMFIIREFDSGTILFMGSVVNPLQK